MATDQPPAIFKLPPEILVHALAQAPPQACSAFSRANSTARDSVDCTALWRALHRAAYDPPHTSTPGPPYDWAAQVKRRTRAEVLISRLIDDSKPVPLDLLLPLLDTLVDLARTRPPVPAAPAPPDSLNERWLEQWVRTAGAALVALHPTLSDPSIRGFRPLASVLAVPSLGTSPPSSPAALVYAARVRQLAAHLHVLATPAPIVRAIPALRTAAKEIVYEQSNFRRDSLYGPFMNDGSGRVDWRKVEALASVCGANLAEAISLGWGTEDDDDGGGGGGGEQDDGDEGGPIVPPSGWPSTRAHSAGPVRTDPAGRDWAGVTHPAGWRGTYAFLHWPTWHHFNRHRDGPPPSLAHEHEAVGDPMVLRLELLPDGEWPPEIDQPDLSAEGLAEEDGDDDDDEDWGQGGSEGSSTEGSSDDDEQPYFATTGGEPVAVDDAGRVASVGLEVTPPTSLPDEGDERDKGRLDASATTLDPDDPPLSPEQLAALAAPRALGPLPAAPHTAASAAYPPPDLTFRPSSSPPSSSTAFPPLAFHGTSLPRLGFAGTFTNAPPSAATRRPSDRSIRGTVSLTPEGHVRWQYVIRYSGVDQWAMNGVQVGGPGSRYGVLGVWTSADRADEGPCGPFWYWPHRPNTDSLDG
ncbi:hypothetical protein JCM3775_000629 [Rhodotorula graminis]|uniref:F-box domain-containing protein n=1 Tax=Rhodotorula graminis (strain WP1) TaxID=578459 RepID=A0A0P9IVX4_RHOGW|nr:uncharacterized protein RHOBADRAFT_54478 [Rhodotorula graminis WP1]KPV73887.1 hypothetical protein RHOBADRAFT_54478 [Rhodotorula graminis WP1]